MAAYRRWRRTSTTTRSVRGSSTADGEERGDDDDGGGRRHDDDLLDAQAGSRGLSVAETVRVYLKSPGDLLVAIRESKREDLAHTAAATKIPAGKLALYESGDEAPTLRDLSTLATHFGADLRVLLEAFGHVKEDAQETSTGIAAQFGGDLAADERRQLRDLVQAAKKKPNG